MRDNTNIVRMPLTPEAERLWTNGWLVDHPEYGVGPIPREDWARYSSIADAIRNGAVRRMLAQKKGDE